MTEQLKTKRATINVFESTKARMAERMKYGDTPDEFINKLLDLADKYSPLPKAPEPQKPPEKGYEAPPKPQEDSKPLEQAKSEGNNG